MITGRVLVGIDDEAATALAYTIVRERDLKLVLAYVGTLLALQECLRDLGDAYGDRAALLQPRTGEPDPAAMRGAEYRLAMARCRHMEALAQHTAHVTALHGTLPSLQQWGDLYFHSGDDQRRRMECDARESIALQAKDDRR